MQYTLSTLAERPELESQFLALHREVWPSFLVKAEHTDGYHQEKLFHCAPHYQLGLCDEEDRLVAVGNALPITWNGTAQGLPAGWDAAFEQGISEYERKQSPTALLGLAVCITPRLCGQGLSRRMLQAMREVATAHDLPDIILPVRPTHKHRYPLIAMEEYAFWKREDGLPFDPWLRVHVKLGASIVKIAQRSTVITGTIQEWQEWTGMRLPQSGSYVIPEALVPLRISHARNEGYYEEPNVWVHHAMH